MILDAVGGLFRLAFAAEGQRSFVDFKVKVFLFHSWKLRADQVRILEMTAADKDAILHGTARRFYNLGGTGL
jgi:hypothetical protein